MRHLLKRYVALLGGLLGLAGLAFVVARLDTYAHQIDLAHFGLSAYLTAGMLILAYAGGNLLLARAWWHLLSFLDVKTDWKWASRAYGLSQLARYVPGNIFHLVGRQALGMAAGLPARALAKSALWELGLIAVAGGLFGLLIVPLLWTKFATFVFTITFLAVSLGLAVALRRWLSPSLACALMWHTVFLVFSGMVFVGTLAIVASSSIATSAITSLCGAYVIAWLAGLVTPGAPAGIGVREAVLLLLLNGSVAEADLLLAVLLTRVVTMGGDLVFYLLALEIRKREGSGR